MARLISIVTTAQESRNEMGINCFPFPYLMHVLCQNKDQYLDLVKIALHPDSICVCFSWKAYELVVVRTHTNVPVMQVK